MRRKQKSGLFILSTIVTIFVAVTLMRYTRCLGEFMSFGEANRILASEETEDLYKKRGYFVDRKFEKQWKAVDGNIEVLVRRADIGTPAYGIKTPLYTHFQNFEVNLSNGSVTFGYLRTDDYEFKVIDKETTYLIQYDKEYMKNEEMEQALGISTESVVEEVRAASESFFETLNKVAENDWIRIRGKAIRNVSICVILWILTILQYVYYFRKYNV